MPIVTKAETAFTLCWQPMNDATSKSDMLDLLFLKKKKSKQDDMPKRQKKSKKRKRKDERHTSADGSVE